MSLNIILLLILTIPFLVESIADLLNIKSASPEIPKEFKDLYDNDKYKKSQHYLKENTFFGLIKGAISLIFTLIIIFSGGLNWLDSTGRNLNMLVGEIPLGLFFVGALFLLNHIIELPFSIYETFIIEKKFGFNKTTVTTFITDELKNLSLTIIIGGPILAFVIYFFLELGSLAWLVAWLAITLVQLAIMFIAPVLIMPLFNKFDPLPEGPLRSKIEDFAAKQNFKIQGIYTMDGGKRSTKANAFFTGFGRFKRIVLFDTLIQKHTDDELVAVLAHEIGHYKKKHIIKLITLSIVTTGLSLYIASLFINNPVIFQLFRVEETSIYASLVFIGILSSPIFEILGVATNYISRAFEFEADHYAVQKFGHPKDFALALKKLSVNNLSNLTPHSMKVILSYSHPPILKRLEHIK